MICLYKINFNILTFSSVSIQKIHSDKFWAVEHIIKITSEFFLASRQQPDDQLL